MSDRGSTTLALALLVVAGLAAWTFQARAPLHVDGESLAGIPLELGSFVGIESPVGDNVEELLQADFNVQREYLHPLGQIVWMYIGYYGTERGGTPEHTPRTCYVAHDWVVTEESVVVTDETTGMRAVEFLVESRGQQQLVLFWYRSYRRTGLLSTLSLQADHVIGKLSGGRGDGALIRLSTPLVGTDQAGARALLVSFARTLEPQLGDRWPAEAPIAHGADEAHAVHAVSSAISHQ